MQCLNDPVRGMAGASILDTVVLHKPLKLKQNFRIKSGGEVLKFLSHGLS